MRHFKTLAGEVHALRFSPDGRSVYLLSVETHITPESIGALPGHAYRVAVDSGKITGDWAFKPSGFATFSPDLHTIYFGPTPEPYSSEIDFCFLHLLDLDRGSVQRVFEFDDWGATQCAISPDGYVLALVESRHSGWGVIHRLDLRTMTELELIQRDIVRLAYSCDGQWLAISGAAGVQIWSGATCVDEWPEPGATLAWSFDGRLAWGTDRQLTVARPGSRGVDRTWEGADDPLLALTFSPDGRLLLGGSTTGTCTFHESIVGECRKTFDWGIGSIHSVAFSPDGLTCAAGGENGQIVVWDVDV